jgi:protein-tyrosine-phosphatase
MNRKDRVAEMLRPLIKNHVLGYIHNLNQLEPELKKKTDFYATQIDGIYTDGLREKILALEPPYTGVNVCAHWSLVQEETALARTQGYKKAVEDAAAILQQELPEPPNKCSTCDDTGDTNEVSELVSPCEACVFRCTCPDVNKTKCRLLERYQANLLMVGALREQARKLEIESAASHTTAEFLRSVVRQLGAEITKLQSQIKEFKDLSDEQIARQGDYIIKLERDTTKQISAPYRANRLKEILADIVRVLGKVVPDDKDAMIAWAVKSQDSVYTNAGTAYCEAKEAYYLLQQDTENKSCSNRGVAGTELPEIPSITARDKRAVDGYDRGKKAQLQADQQVVDKLQKLIIDLHDDYEGLIQTYGEMEAQHKQEIKRILKRFEKYMRRDLNIDPTKLTLWQSIKAELKAKYLKE